MNERVVEIVREFDRVKNQLQPYATVLSYSLRRCVKDRLCSAYPACAAEVKLAGGQYADIAVTDAITDGHLVTAPAWPAHPAWLAQFVKVLGAKISI